MSAKTASITFARCTALLAGISSLATAAAAQQLAPQEAQVASRMQTAERVEVVPMSVIETPTGAAPIYRRDNGAPVGDNRNSKTAGDMGPVLLEDAHLIEKLARFDRERVPERVVHARGTGAKGMFRATADISDYSMASLFQPGKETPVFVRFSSVIHGHLSPEYLRDPHGFATKFYTDEGNWDLVGNNLPVFFIRDAMQFPDMVHSLKPDPVTNRQDPNRFFDFFSHVPEATNMLTHLYTNLGTPASYREMDGNGVHAFRLVNDEAEQVFAKFRWISDQGVKNYTAAQAKEAGFNYLTDDLYGAISRGDHPSWNLMMQVLPVAEIESLDYNPFDDTKEWLDRPWMKIGEMTLDEVPENFFEWTEQSAFAPSNMVPGIEPSPDRMLQGRLFSYADTQRYRVGANLFDLEVNAPRVAEAGDGPLNNNQNGQLNRSGRESHVNYFPSAMAPKQTPARARYSNYEIMAMVDQKQIEKTPDFEQPGIFWRSLSEADKAQLIANLSGDLGQVVSDRTRTIMVSYFYQADPEYGTRLAGAVNVAMPDVMQAVAEFNAAAPQTFPSP